MTSMKLNRSLPLLLLTSLCCYSALQAQYTVSSTTDDGSGQTGTLSWAINQANSSPQDINFSVSSVTLSGNLPPIQATGAVTINPPGGTTITLDGHGYF